MTVRRQIFSKEVACLLKECLYWADILGLAARQTKRESLLAKPRGDSVDAFALLTETGLRASRKHDDQRPLERKRFPI